MGFWLIAGLVFGIALIAGMLMPRKDRPPRPRVPQPGDDEDLGTVEALARLGTPEAAEWLVEQGLADDLRGLGYRGEIPNE